MTIPALFAFDVDGVLTDGTLLYTPSGVGQRFSAHDGAGIAMLLEGGIRVALISFRDLESTRARAGDLGITILALGARDKAAALRHICDTLGIPPSASLYMGDDTMDIPALRIAGWPVCPANAHPSVKEVARMVTRAAGGAGAVREVIDAALEGRLD